jgi:hypothetical protein
MNDESETRGLREEVERLLAAALKNEANHEAEMQRPDEAESGEVGRVISMGCALYGVMYMLDVCRRPELRST